jgi:hypothetical protein
MRRRRGQLLAADLSEVLLYLRAIERRVLHGAGLSAGATDEHGAHAGRGITRHTPPTLRGLVIRMGMKREQATRACTRITSDAEHLRLRGIGKVGTGHRRLFLLRLESRRARFSQVTHRLAMRYDFWVSIA